MPDSALPYDVIVVGGGVNGAGVARDAAGRGARVLLLEANDLAFVRQLGKQLWRLATQTAPDDGGGTWPRRVQRWRGPK